MIITEFIIIGLFAVIFLFIGFIWRADAFKITGFTILFLMGTFMLFGQLNYENGAHIVYNSANTTYVVNPSYTAFDSHTASFLITIMGFVGFLFTLVDKRNKKKQMEEDDE